MNESTKSEQYKRRMAELQAKIIGWTEINAFFQPQRRKLVEEDTWTYATDVKEATKKQRALQVSTKKMQSVRVFVFSDSIIIAKPITQYHGMDGFFNFYFAINLVGAVLSTQKNTEGTSTVYILPAFLPFHFSFFLHFCRHAGQVSLPASDQAEGQPSARLSFPNRRRTPKVDGEAMESHPRAEGRRVPGARRENAPATHGHSTTLHHGHAKSDEPLPRQR